MKITLNRVLIFLSLVLGAGLMLQQCWQGRSDAEKWLYLFDDQARVYAGRVLGPDRGTGLAPPEALAGMTVRVHEEEGYVEFSSTMFAGDGGPSLDLAFAPAGAPPGPANRPGFTWVRVRDGWYRLQPVP